MILTKASFLHVDWHTTYWSERFKSLRSYVDSGASVVTTAYLVPDRRAP